MQTQDIEYQINGKKFVGYLADGSNGKKTAGVLVAHEGGGMTGHPKERARMLAELGYVAFAMDTFGEAIESREQAMAVIGSLSNDLATLRNRANTALELLKAQPNVDRMRTAAIGFCFGGTTVLELARSGADVGCVVGFHSGLATIAPQDAKNIRCKVMVCLGAEDPIIPAAAARRLHQRDAGRQRRLPDADLRQCRTQLHEPRSRRDEDSRIRLSRADRRRVRGRRCATSSTR